MLFEKYLSRRIVVLLITTFVSAIAQAEPAAGTPWTEPTTGMEFVWVPGGCFNQGATNGKDKEQPIHQVCVKGFYLGKYEVTQEQYQKLMGSDPSEFKGAKRPVEKVSWVDAEAAAQKMAVQSKTKIGLPSESQWEYACRAGEQQDVYCGAGDIGGLAWYSENSDDTTHDVGGKRPNAWNLHDMTGNVWEWTQDCYHDSYDGAPKDGSAWTTGDCDDRVTRGGGWNRAASRARFSYRGGDGAEHRDDNIGFRLARFLP